eukprot:m.20964 g.20964  ORF g.20964 m.20964 type:complete len:1169 (-) comp8995_c2_seq1:100-3606(-)
MTPSRCAPLIKRVMAANRGEIAIRIFRAATELEMETVAIYSKEDIRAVHRYKADEAYMLNPEKGPVAAYLSIDDIIKIAKEHDVHAIHPGYGFLSESVQLAAACEKNGIKFVGPTSQHLHRLGDKTEARTTAINAGLQVVGGTPPVASVEEARSYIEGPGGFSYPVIIKAAMGGGGRGIRIARDAEEFAVNFKRCQSEALAAFGDGTVFVEKYIERPRHIEVQILGDGQDVVHLFERDCSVQRRHQKVVEIAPAPFLPSEIRDRLCQDAVAIGKSINYVNAGTVEFLVDTADGKHYFMEVNPRIQVEHTVTEQVTGVDLVQSQLMIAGGATLKDLNLNQNTVSTRGYAIQARITTEDPLKEFAPDIGRIQTWRPALGYGIRLDGGSIHDGAEVLPYYDSMLVKITASAMKYEDTVHKLSRALVESRIRGVRTNIPFVLNVLRHPEFLAGNVTTRFIEQHPELMRFPERRNRAGKLLNYLGDLIVNGRSVVGAVGPDPEPVEIIMPSKPYETSCQEGFKNILDKEGPKAFAKAVREHKGHLLMDTTWRDAHQSLLATRLRTKDILTIAPATSHILKGLYSIENWGGATFDVALRFLHECPWERLQQMRELVPNVPFQMLLRGANAVGYKAYPDNVIFEFCKVAHKYGMDVFRVFDSLNDVENLRIGIDAAGSAGGVVEGTLCYSGDLSSPKNTKYTLDYYLKLAQQLIDLDVHVLCIKDMAGVLKPKAAEMLVGALRREHPTVPIHVHTHDTSGLGVFSMVSALNAGADVVDAAMDSMSGMTSQPSMGAIVSHFMQGSESLCGVDPRELNELNEYWESTRLLYSPFESGQKSGSADVFMHEIPGGQYTNLFFQATSLGLSSEWRAIKKAYTAANRLCGDIVKVTPSSKVVGDLAQFMVQNNLSEQDVIDKAEYLNFPTSVIEYFQGYLGSPLGGFPEPLRSRVVKDKPLISGRPGAHMPAMDLEQLRLELHRKHSPEGVRNDDAAAAIYVSDADVMSAAMYPKEFDDYKRFQATFGDVSKLPTREFIAPMKAGGDVTVDIQKGKTLLIKHVTTGPVDPTSNERQVYFDVNGVTRVIPIKSKASGPVKESRKADPSKPGSLGAPMPGAVVEVHVGVGDKVKANQPLIVLNAMKMETVVVAPHDGIVTLVEVGVGDTIAGGDLLLEVQPSQ